LHWLAYGCWPLALAHTFGMGTDARERWVIALGVVCVLSVGIAYLWQRRATAARQDQRSAATARAVPQTRLVSTSNRTGRQRGA
jgi:hypothetical protein